MHFVETYLVQDCVVHTSNTDRLLPPGITEVSVTVSPTIWLTLGLGHALVHNWAFNQVRPAGRRFECVRVVLSTSWGLAYDPKPVRVARWARLPMSRWGA